MSSGPSKPKIRKKEDYVSHFQDAWLENVEYKNWLIKINEETGKCKLCWVTFITKHDGEKAVKAHMNSKKHKRMIQNINSNQVLTTFLPQENLAENFKVAIAEMSQIYYNVSHHHSYLSMIVHGLWN
ncbi:putative zinc finger protein 862 isoform x1 [Lasius niger]|uniref:Putative zinc finger protein 862 isoform x1 n=1 Tax=Lasius niger TaxID=67767 RepID=A0A0J7KAY5_LASNI|nr:putative zinc finger protein 862 isoform x1 [Lasius niger]